MHHMVCGLQIPSRTIMKLYPSEEALILANDSTHMAQRLEGQHWNSAKLAVFPTMVGMRYGHPKQLVSIICSSLVPDSKAFPFFFLAASGPNVPLLLSYVQFFCSHLNCTGNMRLKQNLPVLTLSLCNMDPFVSPHFKLP